MPILDPLRSTLRLGRDIKAQSQQLDRDIERVKETTAQLRHTAAARVTSPLGLLSALGAGFLTGKLAGRPSQPQRIAKQSVDNIAASTLSTARALGLQVVLPLAIEWFRTKFAQNKIEETADAAKANSETSPKNSQ